MYDYFTNAELSCHCGKCGLGPEAMNPETMQKLIELREFLGFPFPVSSAIRCPEHNNKVSSTGLKGPHTTGRSLDIKVSGQRAFQLISTAAQFGFTGIGISQKGAHGSRYVHLDDLPNSAGQPRPWVWSY